MVSVCVCLWHRPKHNTENDNIHFLQRFVIILLQEWAVVITHICQMFR